MFRAVLFLVTMLMPTSSIAQTGVFEVTLNSICANLPPFRECVSNQSGYLNAVNSLSLQLAANSLTAKLIGLQSQRSEDQAKAQQHKIDEMRAALQALTNEIKAQNELMRTGLRKELIDRMNAIPLELARDDQAYGLLKQRLLKDLADVFAPRQAN